MQYLLYRLVGTIFVLVAGSQFGSAAGMLMSQPSTLAFLCGALLICLMSLGGAFLLFELWKPRGEKKNETSDSK